ncbi:UNVERIFIED_CONTAM: hypothetical protein Sradi_2851200 [Sesamum radiatum]|uniref:Cupin type-1 domain-containing protein n=1 Tax=Sesamum radiatum TaxID=300843 RepID=A0AAW2RWP7_SESRA
MESNSSPQTPDAAVYEDEAGGFYPGTGPQSPAIPQGSSPPANLFCIRAALLRRTTPTLSTSVMLPKVGKEINMPSQPNCDSREYVFNLDDLISSGVNYAQITGESFPLLDQIGLSTSLVRLEPNSVLNPSYSANGSQIIYVVKGSGRVQIMGLNGSRVLDADVQEDQAFVVPKLFVATQLAGEHGMELVSVSTSSRPIVGQLAGRESAWNALSSPVLQAALNVSAEFIEFFKSKINL